MKVYVNGQGHMTKMATMAINSKNMTKMAIMAINSKNLYKSYSPGPEAYDFETFF